jgi:hypothetical protein
MVISLGAPVDIGTHPTPKRIPNNPHYPHKMKFFPGKITPRNLMAP